MTQRLLGTLGEITDYLLLHIVHSLLSENHLILTFFKLFLIRRIFQHHLEHGVGLTGHFSQIVTYGNQIGCH